MLSFFYLESNYFHKLSTITSLSKRNVLPRVIFAYFKFDLVLFDICFYSISVQKSDNSQFLIKLPILEKFSANCCFENSNEQSDFCGTKSVLKDLSIT